MTDTKDLQRRLASEPADAEPSAGSTPPAATEDPDDDAGEQPARATSLRRVWWVTFLAFFLLPAAWALGTPYNGAYDEHHHIVRAAGVVRGQVLVPPVREFYDGGYQAVPRSLVPPNPGCMGDINSPATCLGTPSSDRTLVNTQTGAARYNPTYYAVVGWPLAFLPTMTGVILTRLLSGLLCAVLLAFAMVTVWPMRRYRLLMLAMLCSTTPILMSLNGLVNPSGLEIDAAILLWAALVRAFSLVAADRGRPAAEHGPPGLRRAVVLAIVAAVVLALGRPAGVAVVGAVVVAALTALASRSAIRGLARRRDVRMGAAAVALAAALAVTWVLVSRIADFGHDAKPVTSPTTEVIRYIGLYLFDYWIQGTIGLFGYGLVPLPTWVILAWGVVQGTLVLLGFGLAPGRRLAYTIVAIPVVCFVIGVAADLVMVRIVGYFMQGRYLLPLWVGMFFLAALAVPERLLVGAALRRVYAVGLAVWSGSMLLGLYLTINHFRHGSGRSALPKTWLPALGLYAPFLTLAAGVALVAVLTWWYVREFDTRRPTAAPRLAADGGQAG